MVGAQKKTASLSKVAEDTGEALKNARYENFGQKYPCISLSDEISAQKCTYVATSQADEAMVQDKYECRDCGLVGGLGMCYVCYRQCHRNCHGAGKAEGGDELAGFECNCGQFSALGKEASDAKRPFKFPDALADKCRHLSAYDARRMCSSMPDSLPGHVPYHSHPLVIVTVKDGFACQYPKGCLNHKSYADRADTKAAMCPRDGYKLCLTCFEACRLNDAQRAQNSKLSASSAFAETEKKVHFVYFLLYKQLLH